jgi:hypothetical protein
MRNLDIKRIILLSLTIVFFIIITVVFYYSACFKFLFLPTGITEGTLIKVSPVTVQGSDVYYSYTVDGKTYDYSTGMTWKFSFRVRSFHIRYLLENPSDSIVDELIPREMFFGLIICLTEVYFMVHLLVGAIGKLPQKWQATFDKRMAR